MPKNKQSQDNHQPSGSPVEGEPLFLVVGKLRHSHGLRGEILMDVITDFPERIRQGKTLYIGENHLPMKVASRRVHGSNLLLAFDGIETSEEVGRLRNQWAYVPASDRPPLLEGEYYHHQILGLQVKSEDGLDLGQVSDILETGANDVYVIRSQSGNELLLPAIQSVILAIDLDKSEMTVHLLDRKSVV
jgi:16S rRNA processing protein RimM